MTVFGEIPPPVVLPRVYLWCTDEFADDGYLMESVAEDGTRLGVHLCDHPTFAMGDLHNQRPRHAAYIAKFGGWGDGKHYRVVEIPVGETPPEPVMEAIRRKNAAAEEGQIDA